MSVIHNLLRSAQSCRRFGEAHGRRMTVMWCVLCPMIRNSRFRVPMTLLADSMDYWIDNAESVTVVQYILYVRAVRTGSCL
jgi:hypothetical protein